MRLDLRQFSDHWGNLVEVSVGRNSLWWTSLSIQDLKEHQNFSLNTRRFYKVLFIKLESGQKYVRPENNFSVTSLSAIFCFVLFSFISMRHFVLKESYMLSLTVCSNLTSCMNFQFPGVNRMSVSYLFVVSMILLPYFISGNHHFWQTFLVWRSSEIYCTRA